MQETSIFLGISIGIILFTLFIILVIVIWSKIETMKEKKKKAQNFKFYFKIDCPNNYKLINLTQGHIDSTLKSFASTLNLKCVEEEEMLKNSEDRRIEVGIAKQLEEFQKNQNELKQVKLNFWTAYSAAKYFNYGMRKEYKEYLMDH